MAVQSPMLSPADRGPLGPYALDSSKGRGHDPLQGRGGCIRERKVSQCIPEPNGDW